MDKAVVDDDVFVVVVDAMTRAVAVLLVGVCVEDPTMVNAEIDNGPRWRRRKERNTFMIV